MSEKAGEGRPAVSSAAPSTDFAQRKKSVSPIIDSDTCNAALSLRAMADAIEPGFDARVWLEARGL